MEHYRDWTVMDIKSSQRNEFINLIVHVTVTSVVYTTLSFGGVEGIWQHEGRSQTSSSGVQRRSHGIIGVWGSLKEAESFL